MTTTQLNTLENSLYALIDKLKRQRKRADTGSIYDNLIKSVTFQILSKDVLQAKINGLVIEGKMINKINRAIEATVNLVHNFTLDTPNIIEAATQRCS